MIMFSYTVYVFFVTYKRFSIVYSIKYS